MAFGFVEVIFLSIAVFLVVFLALFLTKSGVFAKPVPVGRPPIDIDEEEEESKKKKQRKLQQRKPRTQGSPKQKKAPVLVFPTPTNRKYRPEVEEDIVKFYGGLRSAQQKKSLISEEKQAKQVKTLKPTSEKKKNFTELVQEKKEKKPKEPKEVKEEKKAFVRKEKPQREKIPNETDENGDTTLHHAAAKGNMDVVRGLLDQGANVNAQNKMGNTPLHEAARQGQIGTTKILLKGGADANLKNVHGLRPEDLAFSNIIKDILLGTSAVTVTIPVPKDRRKVLLGVGGRKAAEISAETGTIIRVPPRDSNDDVTVRGRKEKVEKAREIILNLIKEDSSTLTKFLEVPKDKHRLIIGKGGWKLKVIEGLGVQIFVPKQDSEEGNIRLRGKAEAIEAATLKIEEFLKEEPKERIPRPQRPKRGGYAGAPGHEDQKEEETAEAPANEDAATPVVSETTEEAQ